ncbi:MAG: transposase, partial [Candidatus Zixiibacteriota bacterium]
LKRSKSWWMRSGKNASRRSGSGIRHPGRVWRYRFWDHVIRDKEDLHNHLDYVHFNSVKHGIVNDPFDYPHSSLGDYLNRGLDSRGWMVLE